MQRMQILQICFHFRVLAMTFCVGVRNCPSRSRWVANKQPPVLDRGKHRPVQLLTNVQSFQNSISTPEKYLRYNGYCWGRLNMCVPLISSDSKYGGDGSCVKGRVFPLITLLVIWRLLLECSSNLKFPRLFPANHPHLSFGRWGCTLHYCQSKMKPCNAQETKRSQLKDKKMI